MSPGTPPRVQLGPADLKDGELRPYEAGGRFILVTRLGSRHFAIDDRCNHAGCFLSSGWLEGRDVVCPCHEHRFDIETGRNATIPRLCGDQQAFPLTIENGRIVVTILDPE